MQDPGQEIKESRDLIERFIDNNIFIDIPMGMCGYLPALIKLVELIASL